MGKEPNIDNHNFRLSHALLRLLLDAAIVFFSQSLINVASIRKIKPDIFSRVPDSIETGYRILRLPNSA